MLCCHIYCSVRDWTRFCYIIEFEKILIHHPHIIGIVADLLFSFLRADLKKSGIAAEFAGCVWTKAIVGKKKLRTKKIFEYVWAAP